MEMHVSSQATARRPKRTRGRWTAPWRGRRDRLKVVLKGTVAQDDLYFFLESTPYGPLIHTNLKKIRFRIPGYIPLNSLGIDPFRALYPNKRDYTYSPFGDTRLNRSRLDFFVTVGANETERSAIRTAKSSVKSHKKQ
jgi:hypothetical protein